MLRRGNWLSNGSLNSSEKIRLGLWKNESFDQPADAVNPKLFIILLELWSNRKLG